VLHSLSVTAKLLVNSYWFNLTIFLPINDVSLNVYLQKWMCGLVDDDDIINNSHPAGVEKSSLVAAVSLEQTSWSFPVIQSRVISPAAELCTEFPDDGMSDTKLCSDVETDTIPTSIPVLMCPQVATL